MKEQHPAYANRTGRGEWGDLYTVYTWSEEHRMYREHVANISKNEANRIVREHNSKR